MVIVNFFCQSVIFKFCICRWPACQGCFRLSWNICFSLMIVFSALCFSEKYFDIWNLKQIDSIFTWGLAIASMWTKNVNIYWLCFNNKHIRFNLMHLYTNKDLKARFFAVPCCKKIYIKWTNIGSFSSSNIKLIIKHSPFLCLMLLEYLLHQNPRITSDIYRVNPICNVSTNLLHDWSGFSAPVFVTHSKSR